MEDLNKKILIEVSVDNQDALTSTEALKKKFKELTNQAIALDDIDYDNSTIGELQDSLTRANTILKELKISGMASEQQIASMGQTVNKLKSTISGAKFDRAFKGFESSVHGVVGTAQLLEGSMRSLGLESEDAEKAIERMMQLMTLKDGVESIGKYIEGMKGVATATGGATKATNLLKLGFQSLGIGLVITAVMYLVNNWNSLYATIKEFIPALDGVGTKFKNFSAIAEGVGKAVIGFIVRPIQSAIEAFNLLKNGDWAGAGKKIISALNPLESLNGVVKDFKSGFQEGVIKKEATENIKKFNDETEKTISLLEAQGGQERQINALKNKMWSNEISQLKKKNKVLSDSDQKRVDELTDLMQLESTKHNKFITDQGKATADSFKQGFDEFKKSLVEINEVIQNVGKSERDKELNVIDKHYEELITKAKKYKQDTAKIDEARLIQRNEINKKYDKEDAEKALSTADTKGRTNVLNSKIGNEEKTIEDVKRIADAEFSALKDSYEKKKVLAKDNAEQLALVEAEYANEVYNINKGLSDKIKAIKDKELQDAKDKINKSTETNVLNTETDILNAEAGLPIDNVKTLSDDQIQLVIDNVNKLHNVKLEQLRQNYEAERLLYTDNVEQLALIDAKYQNDIIKANKESSDNIIAIKKDENDKKEALIENNLTAVSGAFGAIGALAEESSVFNKALSTASAIIDTYVGANKALAQGGIFGIASAVGIIATGLANVKKIMSTKVSDKETTSNTASIQAPVINTTQLAPRQTQDVRVINNEEKRDPLKAYVVYSDIKTNEEKDKIYRQNSSY